MAGVFTHVWPYRAASRLTDRFPRAGATLLDAIVRASAGNPLVLQRALAAAEAALARARALDRILVISDLNIGDAVMLQSAVTGLRDFLPAARIDYAVSHLAGCLVTGNAEATEVHPVLGGASAGLPALRQLIRTRRYDLIFNFCPFFAPEALAPDGTPVVGVATLASRLIRATADPSVVAHVTTEAHRFVHGLLAPRLAPVGDQPFRGVSVWLSAEARERAAAFLRRAGLDDEPMVLLSPDASSPFTRPPLTVQTELLRRLLRLAGRVVLGAGHTEPGLEQRLLAALPPAQRARIAVLPATLPLDGFAAVMDAAAVLVTGDTGPLHVAAARKQRRDGALGGLRNRTALVSVFGATPARMYGYASDRAGFLPANQEAPSYAHAGASACRNLTCIRKTAKTCRSVRCFDGLDIEAVLADAGGALAAAGRPGAIGRSTGR